MNRVLRRKLDSLRALLPADASRGGLVAVSGGLDSRLLAHVLWAWELPFLAVHLAGPHVPMRDSARAATWLAAQQRPFEILEVDPLSRPEVLQNTRERCYACKGAMFRALVRMARERKLPVIVEGSHASDLHGFRPGLRALRELGVLSPWADAGLSKPELRELARDLGLADPDQPSRPCLFTRLDYGLPVTTRLLSKLSRTEEAIEDMGLRDFRLRLHSDGRAVVQILESERGHARGHEAAIRELVRAAFATAPKILYSASVSGYFDNNHT